MLSASHQGTHQGLVPTAGPRDGVFGRYYSHRVHQWREPDCFRSGPCERGATLGLLSRLRHGAQPQNLALASRHGISGRRAGARGPWVAPPAPPQTAAGLGGRSPRAPPSAAPYRHLELTAADRRRHLTAARASSSGSSGSSSGSSSQVDSGSSGSSSSGSTSSEFASGSAAVASAAVAASVAAAAVAGAVASVTPPPPPRATAMGLLLRVVSLLRTNFLVVLLLYAVKDGAAFLLHRVTQRLTNHAAEVLLGTPITTSGGNPWWLLLEPGFVRAHPGYELLIGVFFLASLPLVIALNSLAFTLAALICTPGRGRGRGAEDQQHHHRHLKQHQGGSGSGSGDGGGVAAAAASPSAPSGGGPLWDRAGRAGVGAALRLPPDDPSAATLADLGIHALPTAPPPRNTTTTATTTTTTTANVDQANDGGAAASAASSSSSPLPEGPPPTASTIAAASSLSAAPPREADSTTTATATTTVIVDGDQAAAPAGGPWSAVRAAAASVAAAWPEVGRALSRVWGADIQFNLRALPLQGLCLLVLPALWALPRLMRIQLALPAAVLEGRAGQDALSRSSNLMTSSLTAYGMPFAALLATSRLLDYAQGVLLVLIPPRWWREVVEVPLLIGGAFLLLKAAVRRLQDLLPLAAFLELTEREAEAARKLHREVGLLQPAEYRQAA